MLFPAIIDADRHVIEPASLWRDYLPRSMHSYIPYLVSANTEGVNTSKAQDQLPLYMINDSPLMSHWNQNTKIQNEASILAEQCASHLASATNPERQIEAMDDSGIATAYLFPTYAMFVVCNDQLDAVVTNAFAKAYNQWLNDYCAKNRDRLKGVGLISRHEPDDMLAVLDQVLENGWTCVVLRPEICQGRSLGHADYNAFWAKCETEKVSIAIHGGTHLQAATVGTDRFESHFALHACSHPLEAQMAFLSLLESGVLERFPQLKFAFLEAGASWLPYWLWRLDEICYKTMPAEVADNITMEPSKYFKRQCWVGFELNEPCLRQVIDTVGANKLLYGSDYPHPDHLQADGLSLRSCHAQLSQRELGLMFESNASTFFNLD